MQYKSIGSGEADRDGIFCKLYMSGSMNGRRLKWESVNKEKGIINTFMTDWLF